MANRKNEYRITKNTIRKNKEYIIYRDKDHNKKIKKDGKYSKVSKYYILTNIGDIYEVVNVTANVKKNKNSKKLRTSIPFPSYHGNIMVEATCKGENIKQFIKDAKKYIKQKDIKI